ncbi:MAG: ester cyclase [Proteobacteria bacterium]|nr:ester cyclase [Pseudomonadota bacterium]
MSDRRQLLMDFMEQVWNLGEENAVDRYLADAYVIYHDPGDPWHGKTLGREAFKHRLRTSRAPFRDQRFTIANSVCENDTVAICWTWLGTHVGDLPGFPATGRTIAMSGITFYFFDADDRLTGHWQAVDRLGVMMQLRA